MYKFLLLLAAVFSFNLLNAQTFNGTGGAIPDNGATPTCFPINVTGVGICDGTYGLASVCINITHTWDSDLEISLTAPDGTSIPLSIQNGGSGDNYTGTCFSMAATVDVGGASAPFGGTYIPDGDLGLANNGQTGTGVWTICIKDVFSGETGTLNSWSITFNNTPAPPPAVIPGCSGNPPAGDACQNATPVCNFDGYCGNTSASYNVDVWPELETAFCGSIENNSFITFVASATSASFNVFVTNSTDGNGIQMFFYDGGCGSGAINVYDCENEIYPDVVTQVTASGLTIGNTYYLMFDGFAGDVCDYSLVPLFGVNILAITPDAPSICVGQSVDLTATGGNGTYTWAGPNLSATSGATVTATPTVTTTYTVTSVDPTGSCPITKDVTVTITNTPPVPVVSSPVTYCQGSSATALTATGTSLSWYAAATGGTGSTTAPVPSTTTVGTTTYYVTQTLICGESVRVPIDVVVVALPSAPTVTTPVTYCQGSTASALTATGTGLLWYTTATGGTGSATAPVPSTTTIGSTTYYVSQTVTTCEGPRAAITVTITVVPTAPVVTSPVSYCQGNTATALTATGSNLLWYTVPTGGTGSATAPIPSTTTVGTTTYYVSQATGSCRGPRAPIVVNVVLATPAPSATNITYCQGSAAVALTATGTSLLWYTVATGGTGSATAPTPSTATIGNTTYYVTQTLSCGESVRTSLVVTITATPSAPTVTSPVTYCQGTTATALTATGTNLLWYTTATGGTGSATAPVPVTTTVGNTIYYVSQSTGTCEGPRAAITVTINSIPAAPAITSPVTYCQGATATALTATGSNLLWYTAATGGTGSATAPTPPTTTAGSTIYYVSQTINSCEGPRAALTVTILPSTAAPTVTSPISYCQGTSATALTATGTGLLWYTVATGGTGSATAPTPSTATVGSTTYYVSQTLAPCGESIRTALVVNITVTPAAPVVTSPVTYCQGTTATALTATGTGLLWYTAATGGTGSATAPTPSTATAGSVTYYLSQTTGVCEGPRAAITVTVNSIPAAPAVTSPVTYCQSVSATALTAAGSNLLWYTAASGGTGTATAPIPSTATAGNINYYVSQSINNCESPRSSITVTTLPPTPAPTAASPVIFCQGSTATALTATGTGLLWYTAATGGTGSAAAPVPSTATAGSTTYYVSQTAAPCGESVRTAVVVNINGIPAAPTTSPITICQASSAAPLTATGTNLLWYTSATGGAGTTSLIPSTVSTGNTTYYVSQTVATCESPRAPLVVTVVSLPPAPIGSGPFTYCQGTTATQLTATGTALLWYTVPTGGTGSATAPIPSTATAGIFTYYVTQSMSCGESVRTPIIVNVNPTPLAPAVTSPVTYCQGTATSAVTATGTNLLWYAAATGGIGSATAPTPSSSTVNNTTYYVSSTLGVCEGPRAALTVIVNPTPGAPAVGGPVTYCQATIVPPLTATGTNLLWYTTATGGIGSANAPSDYTATVGTTTYYVSQTTGVCEGPRASITVTINPYPNLGPNLRDTVCFGDSVNLSSKFNTTGFSIRWTLNGQDVTNPDAVHVSGAYQLEATNSVGCSDTVFVFVIIQPSVKAFAGNDTTAIKGVPHQLMASGGVSYVWTPTYPLNFSNIQNPLATLDHDQQFYVTVTDVAGCTGTDKIFIQVYDGPAYYIPNAFSPNGDGLNDIFRVVPVGIVYTDWFRIFNRFGQLVFESNQWLKGWDGTYLGKKQPMGNYVWMIRGLDKYGKVVELKGTVLLVQ